MTAKELLLSIMEDTQIRTKKLDGCLSTEKQPHADVIAKEYQNFRFFLREKYGSLLD